MNQWLIATLWVALALAAGLKRCSMQNQHRSHLVSTYATILEHLEEIRQVVTVGKTPAGATVTPFPEPQRERLLAGLEAVAAALAELVEAAVPDWQRTAAETGGPAATRMWVNILLRRVEELAEGLLPHRMTRRYGAMEAAHADRIQRHVNRVLAALRGAMRSARERGED